MCLFMVLGICTLQNKHQKMEGYSVYSVVVFSIMVLYHTYCTYTSFFTKISFLDHEREVARRPSHMCEPCMVWYVP